MSKILDQYSTMRRQLDDLENSTGVDLTRAEQTRERRSQLRKDLLDAAAPDRVCPFCERPVIAERSWVITRGGAKCRSCHQRALAGQPPSDSGIRWRIIAPRKLRDLREEEGWSLTFVAAELEVSVSTVSRMERQKGYQIRRHVKQKLFILYGKMFVESAIQKILHF